MRMALRSGFEQRESEALSRKSEMANIQKYDKCPFTIGQKIKCVDEKVLTLVVGEIYTIIGFACIGFGTTIKLLERPGEITYWPDRFVAVDAAERGVDDPVRDWAERARIKGALRGSTASGGTQSTGKLEKPKVDLSGIERAKERTAQDRRLTGAFQMGEIGGVVLG